MFDETMLKLPFTDGYYSFKEKVFVPKHVACMARVPHEFPERDDASGLPIVRHSTRWRSSIFGEEARGTLGRSDCATVSTLNATNGVVTAGVGASYGFWGVVAVRKRST